MNDQNLNFWLLKSETIPGRWGSCMVVLWACSVDLDETGHEFSKTIQSLEKRIVYLKFVEIVSNVTDNFKV